MAEADKRAHEALKTLAKEQKWEARVTGALQDEIFVVLKQGGEDPMAVINRAIDRALDDLDHPKIEFSDIETGVRAFGLIAASREPARIRRKGDCTSSPCSECSSGSKLFP